MKLLALDQASKITGWAFFEEGNLKDYGKISLKDDDIGERLYKLREELKSLIETIQPDKVIFEDIQLQNNVGNNVQTFKVLAEVFGIVYELVTELNISNEAVLAGTWKSTLGIKGKNRVEQKRNAQAYVVSTYGVKATQDESDAICIGAHYTNKNKNNSDIPIINGGFDWSD